MTATGLSVAEACAAILRDVAPLEGGADTVALRDAVGRVLAEEVRSPVALPPWDNASMDGYAVRGASVRGASREAPVTLRVTHTVPAGGERGDGVREGEAARIMTGAPVPGGADSVIRVEDTDAGEASVRIFNDRDVGRNIRPAGEDIRAGDVAGAIGDVLTPGRIGFLASVGRGDVRVRRRPKVAILSTGDELVDVDRFDDVRAGRRIVTSNSYSLFAAVREAGAEAVALGTVRDDPDALRMRIADCTCDLLLTTGGVSVGAFDFTRRVIQELGGEHRFWRVKIRPGAPLGFAMLGSTPWLGLPGNPVSALVTFELFARPAIRRMLGFRQPFRSTIRVRVAEKVSISAPLTHFLRARLEATADGLSARLTGPQGSGLLSSMALADALLVIPPERQEVAAGEVVDALVLGEASGYTDRCPVA